ncbi:MAG: biotin--[acetyl-CoA-carboxylase] ligase [Acidimicrobiia bacterium]|nr:biotin--[acetyl-CoA-carboxylase] ligase [Acidimicrobiia bacterium]
MDTSYVLVPLGTVASTQNEARHRYSGSPVLVTAERQEAGRGRTGRSWVHADRAVAASLALRPSWPRSAWERIPLVSGLAAAAALGPEVRLKWPNDLLVGDDKVGGLLVESDGDVVVAGFGVNLYWEEPVEGATGLLPVDPGGAAADLVAEHWATELLRRLGGSPGAWGRDEYRDRCATIGRAIVWEPDGSGTAVDVAPDGALVVDTPRGRTELRSGEVRAVRRA